MDLDDQSWLREYAFLALRIERQMAASGESSTLLYTGPAEWRDTVSAEEPTPPAELSRSAQALRADPPFPAGRRDHLDAQLDAMLVAIRRLAGQAGSPEEDASASLGVEVRWQDEVVFEQAHQELAAALPPGAGSLADRLRSWEQLTATATAGDRDRVREAALAAVAETRRRTEGFVALPPVAVEVVFSPGPHRGEYRRDGPSRLHLSQESPPPLADLLYVVAHEGFPGHVAESLLTDQLLIHDGGQVEHQVRFMISPSFVVSEGLGLVAQEVVFPGEEAQRWLTDIVLVPHGWPTQLGDLAAIHRVRNVLWGAWGNAALMVGHGRGADEVADYLRRWALLDDDGAEWAVGFLGTPGMDTYVLGYFHGWRLVSDWIDHPDRTDRVRRLLTEPLLPSDLN